MRYYRELTSVSEIWPIDITSIIKTLLIPISSAHVARASNTECNPLIIMGASHITAKIVPSQFE
jgi:hypothetical protein